MESLQTAYLVAAVSHQQCLAQLGELSELLSELDEPWVVVKGPVLTERSYGDPGLRYYGDVDVVVSPSGYAGALALMEAAGGHIPDLNWPLITKQGKAELPISFPLGVEVDLHWQLLVSRRARTRFRFPIHEVLDRRRSLNVGGTVVDALDPVDEVLHLSVHGSLSGGHYLLWLKDIERTVTREHPDWDVLVDRARRWHLDLVSALQLERARSLLGAPVPASVVQDLARDRMWFRWWCRGEEREGNARWGRMTDTGRTIVRATSGDTRTSALQLGIDACSEIALPACRRQLPRWQRHHLAKRYQPVGSEVDRQRYLDLVAISR